MISSGDPVLDALLRPGKGEIQFVDVPGYRYLMLDGAGAPDGERFAAAVQALYSVSYAAHFALKRANGTAPRVMPLEALWWVDDPAAQDLLRRVAEGSATMAESDRDRWHWRAMILQLPPIDDAVIADAIDYAQARGGSAALTELRSSQWAEGSCAQLLHIGPYAAESANIVRLHEAISARGLRPRGHHHEIYLSDPRRSAPEKLRTILRQPCEPVPG